MKRAVAVIIARSVRGLEEGIVGLEEGAGKVRGSEDV